MSAYWICQISGWGLWASASAVMYASYGRSRTPGNLLITLWMGLIGLTGSHLLRGWIKRAEWTALSPLRALPRILGASIALAAAITVANWIAMIWLFHAFRLEDTRWSGFVSSGLIWIAVMLLWSGIYFSVKYFERYRKSEVERLKLEVTARDAQLGMLRAQVNPHFLFNSLNSIRALIRLDPEKAQDAVTQLSQLLRYSLQSDGVGLVTLREELAVIENYLALEKVRLEERLSIVTAIAPESETAKLPPMLLQTLVENGIKHGVAKLATGGRLGITARMDNGALMLQVSNPGRLGEKMDLGIGLKNARERLRLMVGGESEITVRQVDAEILAVARIPQ